MAEIPKRSLEAHPLWPLYKLITVEMWMNFHRLLASDFQDTYEADFKAFLEEEAKDRLSQEIAVDFIAGYVDHDTSRSIISDPQVRREYESGWKNLFLKARTGPLDEAEITREIDHLFDIWNKSQKTRVSFSIN